MSQSELLPSLLLDGSGSVSWVALATSDGTTERSAAGKSSEVLARFANELIYEHHLKYQDLCSIIVVTGPGSFTGIRASLAFCEGIKLATGANCIGVSVFQSAAALLLQSPGHYLLRLPANKNEDYVTTLEVLPDKTASSDWTVSTIPICDLETKIKESSDQGTASLTVVSVDEYTGICLGRKAEALLVSAASQNLRGPALPAYGKPVQAKTLEERGLSASFAS